MQVDLNHRSPNERLNALLDEAIKWRNGRELPRTYLGGSRLGVPCERALQFEFFHTEKDAGKEFRGQTLRIFDVGHSLEELAISWIREAGFDLRTQNPDTGRQYGFSIADGRIRGHLDGVLCSGPNVMAYPALWECKTMSAKYWRDCVKHGVAKSKPVYAAQIAIYQANMNLTENPAVFTAINKDTEEIYFEFVPFHAALAGNLAEKGSRMLQACDAGLVLPRIASSPDHLECKWCSWASRCWSMPL
jgi:hypothetical protein